MDSYSQAAVERAMKVQEVILRAMAKKITWWQAAEIIGHQRAKVGRWRQPRQFRFESDQGRYRSVVRLRLLLEISPNEVWANRHRALTLVVARPARTLASKYSSRWRLAQSDGSSLRSRRLTIKLPSSVLTISAANCEGSTSLRISPRRCPSLIMDCRRSSQEPRARRAFSRSPGFPSSESTAVLSSGQ